MVGSAANAVRPGALFAGKYRIDRLIGRGGMGSVFAATHVELDQAVAIKLLLPELANDEQLVARFVREAKAAAKISGDHVARVLDVSRLEDATPYIVLELLHGIDLSEYLEKQGPLPIELAVDCVIHACHALAQAHAAGVVHRDVKPSNLFMTTLDSGAPRIKVLDFGISKLASSEPDSPSVTRTREVFGSPLYMSPEQIRSSRDVDGRGDLWALGIVLFELLTGRTPFEAESTMAVAGAILHQAPHLLRSLRPDAPAEIESIIACCLEKDASKRPQTAGELAVLLRPFASAAGQLVADATPRLGGARSSAPQPRLSTPAPAKDLGSAPTMRDSEGRGARTVVRSPHAHVPAPAGAPIGKIAVAMAIVALGVVGLLALRAPWKAPAHHQAAVPGAADTPVAAPEVAPAPTTEPSFAVEPQPPATATATASAAGISAPHVRPSKPAAPPRATLTAAPSAARAATVAAPPPSPPAPPAVTRMPRTGE